TGGGSLKPEYRDMWADYICRYIEEFQKRGYEVERISIQNEPKAVQTWDSCIFTAEQEKEFLRDHLYPALVRHGLGNVEVFIWDHNKERLYERVRDTVDGTQKGMVSGAAFHWYSGDHFEALDLVRRQYPDLKLITSESCIEYRFHEAGDLSGNAAKLAHELMGGLNHGINAFYDWNLLLDGTGGPNYVGNLCHAPFMFDTKKRELIPQLLQRYYWHFSRYIAPGSVRIGLSRYTDKLEACAFRRPDGLLAAALFNRGAEAVPVILRMGGQIAEMSIAPQSILSALIG
ncbi:MAG: glucosylceramidase, partial [Oscillospiraceae bacterium]|nr:glucosylceramidase [Oscillospiraceae bacterium]